LVAASAVVPIKPSDIRLKSGRGILIFCRILKNIPIRLSHSKQQKRLGTSIIFRSNDSATTVLPKVVHRTGNVASRVSRYLLIRGVSRYDFIKAA
jgi:2,3-bisphosphoglycerate-independent phosphoglycerate mutase